MPLSESKKLRRRMAADKKIQEDRFKIMRLRMQGANCGNCKFSSTREGQMICGLESCFTYRSPVSAGCICSGHEKR